MGFYFVYVVLVVGGAWSFGGEEMNISLLFHLDDMGMSGSLKKM